MQTKKIISLIVLLILVSSAFFAIHQAAAVTVGDIEKLKETIPQLRVKIPGMEDPKEPTTVTKDDKTYIVIPWIANYISAIYKYALGLASVMAVVAVMIGGILYLTSAGAPQRVEQGKKIIIGAITGLIIIVFSYVFLNLINPELIKLKPIVMETIKQELIAVDVPCSELPAADVDVIVDGVPTSPSNAASFHCGQKYPVRAKASSRYSVAEGQLCDGAHCQGNKACVDKECITGLFKFVLGGTTLTFPRTFDSVQLLGINSMSGAIVEVSEVYGKDVVAKLNTFIIPFSDTIKTNLQSADKFFFKVEINDTDAYAPWAAYASGKYKAVVTLGGLLGKALRGKLVPTGDDDFYVVRSYSNAAEGIWGFPTSLDNNTSKACPTCTILEKDDYFRFGPRKPWCKFWTKAEISNAFSTGKRIVVKINVDNFPEDPTDPPPVITEFGPVTYPFVKLLIDNGQQEKVTAMLFNIVRDDIAAYPITYCGKEIGCQSEIVECNDFTNNTPPLPGTPCSKAGETKQMPEDDPIVPDELEGIILKCLCVFGKAEEGQGSCEWVRGDPINKSKQGELCANYGMAPNTPTDTFTQVCDTGVHCHYQCGYTAEECETNPTIFCTGRCQPEQMTPVVGKNGGPCICGSECPDTAEGEKLYCNSDKNICTYGEWGNHCQEDAGCNEAEGFKCHGGWNLCMIPKITQPDGTIAGGADQWHVCNETVDCANGLECDYVNFIDSDNGGCNIYPKSFDSNDIKLCWDPAKNDNINGLCDCNSNSDCANNQKWPKAVLCNTKNQNYCTEIIAGAVCEGEENVTLLEGGFGCLDNIIKRID